MKFNNLMNQQKYTISVGGSTAEVGVSATVWAILADSGGARGWGLVAVFAFFLAWGGWGEWGGEKDQERDLALFLLWVEEEKEVVVAVVVVVVKKDQERDVHKNFLWESRSSHRMTANPIVPPLVKWSPPPELCSLPYHGPYLIWLDVSYPT